MPNKYASCLVAATVASVAHHATATDTDLSWHAPNATAINNLTEVLGGFGVYGFVYDYSTVTESEYGVYNWCNMPHVRASEYIRPSPEYTLQYVEVIHRHHKRTVYASNAFPTESYEWDCDDEEIFHYGNPKEGIKSARVYRQQFVSAQNPFTSRGFAGTCQLPQITAGGLDDSWQHGKDIYGVYHDLLGFLPDKIENTVTFRVTQNVITSEVAGMLISGMFGSEVKIPLWIEASSIDSLEPTYSCRASANLFNAIKSGSNWTTHLTAASSLYSTLDDISGVPPTDPGFHTSLNPYYDNLSARLCHAKPLPCKHVNGVNSTTCMNQSSADEVFRLGHYEYSYIYRDDPRSLPASASSFGVWIAELTTHLRDFVAGKSEVIYRHNIAHDGSISRLLSVLQLDQMVWPGMGSEVIFELYKMSNATTSVKSVQTTLGVIDNDEYYVRVLWMGQVLRSSNPSLSFMDMVPLETILAYFDGLVGAGANLVEQKCDGTIPL